MKNDHFRLAIMAIFNAVLLIGALVFGIDSFLRKEINLGNIISFIAPLILVVFITLFLIKNYREINKGMPLEDQRSKRIIEIAATKTFYFSLFWLIMIGWFQKYFAKFFNAKNLTSNQAIGIGISGIAIVFFIFWFYFERKNRL